MKCDNFTLSVGRSPSRLALLLFPLVVAGSLLLWGAGAEAIAATYTTNFPLTENPISEGGHWINGLTTGIDWSDVQTTPGQAFGTEMGPNYADPTALLTGSWGPTQTVQAVVYILAADSSTFEEVELRLRSSLSAHSCTGYEVIFSVKPDRPYCQIVRWNGPLGDFSLLNARRVGVVNGDVVKATAVGSTITSYINNTAIFSVNDTTYPSGNPGMGFYLYGGLGSPLNSGFSSYTASDGSFAAVILATEPANLKGYWKCDETNGTTLVDSSGNSKNLTLHGVAGSAYSLAQSGEQGASIRFYGTMNSYADRSDSPNSILGSSNLQNTNWTMFALVKGDAQSQKASVMGLGNSGTFAPFVDMDSGPSLMKIRAQIRNNDFSHTVNFEGGTAFDSIWHSVVFRRNGTNFDTFVDGVITGAFSGTPTITNPIVATSLGKLIKSGNQYPSLNGYIQHAAIWNRALSDSEIMAIQAARTVNPTPSPTPTATPTPIPGSFAAIILATEPANLKGYWKCNETSGTTLADSSGNSKNLTITGAINTNYWLGETGEQGTCFRTDGVAGYASRNDAVIPSLDNTNFTLFALFKGGTDFGSAAA